MVQWYHAWCLHLLLTVLGIQICHAESTSTRNKDLVERRHNVPAGQKAYGQIGFHMLSTDEIPNDKEQNNTKGLANEFPRKNIQNVKQIIYKFDAQCQRDAQAMDSSCRHLLKKLKQALKTELKIPNLQTRSKQSRAVCMSTSPKIRIAWYNPSVKLCCNGMIHTKITGKEMCCGTGSLENISSSRIYNSRYKLCCDGLLYKKANSSLICCGKYVFDKSSSTGCCNGTIYDKKHKFCCDDQTLHHNIGRHNSHGQCCGRNKFDDRCYFCNKTSNRELIYPKFDPHAQRCCHGQIRNIDENKTVCCGKHLMDESKYQCTDNSIYVKKSVGAKILNDSKTDTETSDTFNKNTNLFYHDDNYEAGTPYSMGPSKKMENILARIIGITVSTGVIVICTIFCAVLVFKRKLCRKLKPDVTATHVVFNNEIECESLPTEQSRVAQNKCMMDECESSYQSLNQNSINNSSLSINSDVAICDVSQTATEFVEIKKVTEDDNLLDVTELAEMEKITEDDNLLDAYETKESIADHIPKIKVCLEKLIRQGEDNLTSELFSDAQTQTFHFKEINQRDIFGRPYQHNQYLSKFNRTVKWDKSDTQMTIPASAVTLHTIYAQASSFDNIPDIFEKFGLDVDVRILSPIVEYCLTGCTRLPEHALVELPIINDGKCKKDVFKFCSDGGLSQLAELHIIPVLEEENFTLDTFCIVKRTKILIYTKTFSGFFCTTHGRRENIILQAFLFGSFKIVMKNQEVRLNLYIADELHKFSDYNQRMFDNEKCEGREKKAEKPLELPDRCLNGDKCILKEDDFLEITASVTGGIQDKWEHKLHPEQNRPIERKQKIVSMKILSKCCHESALPHQVGWYFINNSGAPPNPAVQCVVDVTCKLQDQRANQTETPLIVDELKIRASDITEVLTDKQMVLGLKRFLTELTEPSLQESIMTKLQDVNRRFHSGVPITCNLADLLSVMERYFCPADFIGTISDILHEIKAYRLLDILVSNKLIPENVLPKSTQPYQSFTVNQPHGNHNGINNSSQSQLLDHQECRHELDTFNSCSFDNRNESNVDCRGTNLSQPRPELRSRANESQFAGLSQTSVVTSELPNTLDEPETEPKTLETQMTDDISLEGQEEAACIIWPHGAQISSCRTQLKDTVATFADSGVRPKIDEGRQKAITSKELVTGPTIHRRISSNFEALRQNNAITSELDDLDESETEPKTSEIHMS